MRRQVQMEEISDGKLYDSQDLVKVGCQDCAGCSVCCKDMGESVILDPWDIYQLTTNLQCSMQQLLQKELELGVADGILLPHLSMRGEQVCCSFLNEEGRCSIHAFRPGLCRLFPLGRKYGDSSFQYFVQIHECPHENKTKVKVRKWLHIPELEQYEKFVLAWHDFLTPLQRYAEELVKEETKQDLLHTLNMYVLKQFFLTPYEGDETFYVQFYERLQEAKETLNFEIEE